MLGTSHHPPLASPSVAPQHPTTGGSGLFWAILIVASGHYSASELHSWAKAVRRERASAEELKEASRGSKEQDLTCESREKHT